MRDINKFRGCLIGGASGDALGYAVEFMNWERIRSKYGNAGISEYNLFDGKALISDDTQMTLYTANGILRGITRGHMRGIMGSINEYVYLAYQDWLLTQVIITQESRINTTWLTNIPELNYSRAPGTSCINALMSKNIGTIENPINNSKGCGGIMRVAPVGLYFENRSAKEVAKIGADLAAITHGHELGYLPAAVFVSIIHKILYSKNRNLNQIILESMDTVKELFPKSIHFDEMRLIVDKAITLSKSSTEPNIAITEIGEGWVAEETLAIALYCCLKYNNDFEQAIIASVNHSGDSDSTGSVTGNIMGTILGYSNIPNKFIDKLEISNIIVEIANDLYNDCRMSEYSSYRDTQWIEKYIKCLYNGK